MNDSIFSKLITDSAEKRQPEPEKIVRGPLKPVAPPANRFSPPAEQLLDFLVNHWRAPTISVRNIRKYGPRSIRENQKNAINLAEILVESGWLAPVKSRRRDMREWRIARKPNEQLPQLPPRV